MPEKRSYCSNWAVRAIGINCSLWCTRPKAVRLRESDSMTACLRRDLVEGISAHEKYAFDSETPNVKPIGIN